MNINVNRADDTEINPVIEAPHNMERSLLMLTSTHASLAPVCMLQLDKAPVEEPVWDTDHQVGTMSPLGALVVDLITTWSKVNTTVLVDDDSVNLLKALYEVLSGTYEQDQSQVGNLISGWSIDIASK